MLTVRGVTVSVNVLTESIAVGDRWSVAAHGVLTRLFDRHGLGSAGATRKFVKRLKEINPDIIHIHNIHGYFLNYPLLFDYLKEWGGPVVWTLHDYKLLCGAYSFYAEARFVLIA